MKFCAAIDILFAISTTLLATNPTATAFVPKKHLVRSSHGSSSLNIVVGDTVEEFEARVDATFDKATPKDPDFESLVQSYFPGAVSNQDLVTTSVRLLASKGYHGENTLLATSLCCDELARQLEDDFNGIYGNNFNLGGLAGFPFAGKTGFGAMAAHIPDDGFCVLVYGPHVGVSADGTVGKVERSGIALVDTCCGSAVAASGYVDSIISGTKPVSTSIQTFLDFQQQGVQELILPHGRRLADAENRMVELPYALYDSQDAMLTEIVETLSTSIKRGLTMLGGIQINTGPDTPDYFVPLKFQSVNYRGEVTGDMLGDLVALAGGDLSSIAFLSEPVNDETDDRDETRTRKKKSISGDKDKAESTTIRNRIPQHATESSKSEIIIENEADNKGDSDINVNTSDNDEQTNAKRISSNTIKDATESDRIITKGSDDRDEVDGDKSQKNTSIIVSEEEIEREISLNNTKTEKIRISDDGNSSKTMNATDVAPTNTIIEKTANTIIEKTSIAIDDNTGSSRSVQSTKETVEEETPNEATINSSDLDEGFKRDHDDEIGKKSVTNNEGNAIAGDPNETTGADVAEVVGQNDDEKILDEEVETNGASSNEYSFESATQPIVAVNTNDEKPVEMHKAQEKTQLEDDAKSSVVDTVISPGSSLLEKSNENESTSLTQNEAKPTNDEETQVKDATENVLHGNATPKDGNAAGADEIEAVHSSEKTKDVEQAADDEEDSSFIESKTSSNENGDSIEVEKEASSDSDTNTESRSIQALDDSSSEREEIISDAEEADILSTNDEKIRGESNRTNSIGSLEDGYFFTKRDSDDSEQRVKSESEAIDLLLDEDHLSWLTTPNTEVEEQQIGSSGNDISTSDGAIEQDDDIFNEDILGVDDTYLLGEQIALALDMAEIDVVGLDDGETIAPALADALLSSIEHDAYDRMNEGWNQFGAESLYSIGEDKDKYAALEDDAFSNELSQQMSINISTTMDDDSRYPDEQELLLVADSIMEIINGDDDDEDDEDIREIETYSETTREAELVVDDDDDDEPPTTHRYVLKPDNTG